MNSSDETKELILRYLYDLSKKALSVDRSKANEKMILVPLLSKKPRHEIISNLIYLLQTDWIKQEKINNVPYYIISDKGVNHFEGSSDFQKSHYSTGINITNIQGVTIIGDNNFVHQEFNELYKKLDLLKNEITKSSVISDQEKLEYQSDIETIKSQLAKKTPNKTIIQQGWAALEVLATIDGVMNFYNAITPIIAHLLK